MVELDTPAPNTQSEAWDVSSRGDAVGEAIINGTYAEAVVWPRGGGYIGLGTLGGPISVAYGINSGGNVVGYSWTGPSAGPTTPVQAFVWENGAMRGLPGLGGHSIAYDINDGGFITGCASTPSGDWRRVQWRVLHSKVTDLGGKLSYSCGRAINAAGQVAGDHVGTGGAFVPALWPGGSADPKERHSGAALGINSTALIVGYFHGPLAEQPFAMAQGRLQALPMPPGDDYGYAEDVDDCGRAVGSSGYHHSPWRHALIWEPDGGCMAR
jgi:probable HAF family extracellular repeat protein